MNQSNLTRVLRAACRSAGLLALMVCAGLAGAQLVTQLTPRTYQAHTSVLLTGGADLVMPTVARLAESREVAQVAANEAGLAPDLVVGHVTSDAQPGMQIITLTADADQPSQAATIANAVAHALGAEVAKQPLLSQSGPVTVQTLDNAAPPSQPATPIPLLNDALGGLLGLLAGLGILSLRRRLDDSLTGPDQIEAELRLPMLAAVPEIPRRPARHGARPAYQHKRVARSIGEACAVLSVLAHTTGQRRLLVTDVGVKDEDLATALLALGLADCHDHISLIDAQLRRSPLARHFPEARENSLQQVLDNPFPRLPARLKTSPTLTVVPAADDDEYSKMSLLREQSFAALLADASDQSDLVLVRAPAVLKNVNITHLANSVDAAVLMVRAGTTRVADARRALLLLQRLGIPTAGVLLMASSERSQSMLAWPNSVDGSEAHVGRTPPPQRASTTAIR